MEQRDYILREIEKISVVLLAITGKLKKVISKKDFEQEREMLDHDLDQSVGLNIDQLLTLSEEELKSVLNQERGFNFDNLEYLSDLLAEMAVLMEEDESKLAYKKAHYLLEWVDKEGKIFSFERQSKIMALKKARPD